MTQSLILDSLAIQNFRVFRRLRIERLGRVNLVTGKNNVGKTCLLEALRLYADRASQRLVWDLLESRDETGLPSLGDEEALDQALAVKYLFHGRQDVTQSTLPIRIGPTEPRNRQMSLSVVWYAVQMDERGRRRIEALSPKDYLLAENPAIGLEVRVGEQSILSYRLARRNRLYPFLPKPEYETIPSVFVSADGMGKGQIQRLWDRITLTDLDRDVLLALRIIAPNVERINLVSEQERAQARMPIVRIADLDRPIPLRSLGEGVNRLFGLALALVNAQEGLLLVDEIESGLHYSVQPDLWRLVFQVARRLNVQVFATTHSWDCIEGFQRAAMEDGESEGLLISLRKNGSEIEAVLFDEHELEIATREQIEVR